MFVEALQLGIDARPMEQGAKRGEGALDRVGKASKKSASELERVEAKANKTGSALNQLSKFGKLFAAVMSGAVVVALLRATRAVRDFAGQSINLFAKQEEAERKVAAAIVATGGAAEKSIADLKRLAATYQELTGVTDDVILNNIAIGLSFKSLKGEVFDEYIRTAINMSEVLGTDLKASLIQVGKALEDPVKGTAALREVGVSLSEAEQKKIVVLAQSNKLAEAQSEIIRILNGQFPDAAALTNTWAFEMKGLKNSITDAKEELGEFLTAGLLPFLSQTRADLQEHLNLWQSWKAGVALAIKDVANALFSFRRDAQDSLSEIARSFAELFAAVPGAGAIADTLLAASERLDKMADRSESLRKDIVKNFQDIADAAIAAQLGIEDLVNGGRPGPGGPGGPGGDSAAKLSDYQKSLAALKQQVKEERVLFEARSLSESLFERLRIAQQAGFDITKKITDEVWEQVDAFKAVTDQARLRNLIAQQTFAKEEIDVGGPKPFSQAAIRAEELATNASAAAALVLENGFVKASYRLRDELFDIAPEFAQQLLDIEGFTTGAFDTAGRSMAKAFGDALSGSSLFVDLFQSVGDLFANSRARNLAGVLESVGGDEESPIFRRAAKQAASRNEKFARAAAVFSAAVDYFDATQKTARTASQQEAINAQKGAAIAQAGAATGTIYGAIIGAVIGFIVANKKALGFDQIYTFGESKLSGIPVDAGGRTGTTGIQPGVRGILTGSKVFDEAGQRFTEFNNLIRRQLNLLLAELGGFLEGFSGATKLFIKGNEEFIVTLHTGVEQVFQNEQDALNAIVADMLRTAEISGLDPLLQAGLRESQATDFEEFAEDLRFLQGVARAVLPETSRAVLELFDSLRINTEKLFLLIEDQDARARGLSNLRTDFLRRLDREIADALGKEIDPSREAAQRAETINRQIAKAIESIFKTIETSVGKINLGEIERQLREAGYDPTQTLKDLQIEAGAADTALSFQRLLDVLRSGQPVSDQFRVAMRAMLDSLVQAGKIAAADAQFINDLLARTIDPSQAAAAAGNSGRRTRRQQREALEERIRQLDGQRLSDIARALGDLDAAFARDAEEARLSAFDIDKLTAAYERQRQFLKTQFLAEVDEFLSGNRGGDLGATLGAIDDKAAELTKALEELFNAGEISRRMFDRLTTAVAGAADSRALAAIGDEQASLQLELLGILGKEEEAAQIRFNITLAELQLRREQLAIAIAERNLSRDGLVEIDKLLKELKKAGPSIFLNDGGGPISTPRPNVGDDRGAILKELRELQNRRLTTLNREFLELTDKLNDLAKRARAARISIDEINLAKASAIGDFFRERIVMPLQDFLDEINGVGAASVLSPLAQQAQALQKLNDLAARAKSGDLDAFEGIPDAGNDFLAVIEAAFGRGEEFAKALEKVNAIGEDLIAKGIAQAAEAGGSLAAEIASARENTISQGEEEIVRAVQDLLRSQEADALLLRRSVQEMADEIESQSKEQEILRQEIRRLVSQLQNG